jgi:hypothetical protein
MTWHQLAARSTTIRLFNSSRVKIGTSHPEAFYIYFYALGVNVRAMARAPRGVEQRHATGAEFSTRSSEGDDEADVAIH